MNRLTKPSAQTVRGIVGRGVAGEVMLDLHHNGLPNQLPNVMGVPVTSGMGQQRHSPPAAAKAGTRPSAPFHDEGALLIQIGGVIS